MFYRTIGKLLAQAADELDAIEAGPLDPRRERELRQLRTLLRRLGVVWPQLFGTLARECELLAATLDAARATLAEHGLDLPVEPAEGEDAFARHVALERELGVASAMLAGSDAAWARGASRALLEGLAAAEAVRGELVDAMLEA